MSNMFQWTKENPIHLSVGAVIVNDEGKILAHKLERIGNKYFLPKKSHRSNMSLEQTLYLVEKETGWRTETIKFLGSIKSTFDTEDGLTIDKTTLYFLCRPTQHGDRDLDDRDADSEIVWMNKDELIKIMKEQGKEHNDLDQSSILQLL
jgi:hypothetical protein